MAPGLNACIVYFKPPTMSAPLSSPHTSEAISAPDYSESAQAGLASVLSVEKLFQVIFKRLHQLYAVDCAVLNLYDSELSEITASYISCLSKGNGFNTCVCNDRTDLHGIAEVIARLAFPILKCAAEWQEEYGINHVLPNGDDAHQYHCYIPLESENRIIGTLELHNYNQELSNSCLAYCTMMNDLLGDCITSAAAPSQGLQAASVHSPEVDSEYEKLLLLCNDIAGIKQQGQLLNALDYHFADFFYLNNLVIAIPDAERDTHSALVMVKPLHQLTDENLRTATAVYPLNDGIYNQIAGVNRALFFDIDELLEIENIPAYVHNWAGEQFKTLIGLPLNNGDEVIGVLYLLLKSKLPPRVSFSLLIKIAAQLGLAVMKVTSDRKIKVQQAEIDIYKQHLEEEKLFIEEEPVLDNPYTEIIGQGPGMQHIFNLLTQVADTETTVLILGETGTGKELIARAIHNGSSRKDKPMIKVNCAAIPVNLIESELFGHEKGSFTGAIERRMGKFELANEGTIFLDEIGELSLELQVKLLRALQEKEIERVGGKSVIHIDVRIISATNRNLAAEVDAGRFRRDLFYRLNVFPVSLPPLRDRKADLPYLASHFLSRYAQKTGKLFSGFSKKAMQDMARYIWPGNIRELEHLIERQVLLAKGPVIKAIDIPGLNMGGIKSKEDPAAAVKTIYENERDHIFNVLKLCNGKVSGNDGAAKLLGVPATTLNSKIKRLSLSKKHIF
jgi:formate hydrogenlyase transcriptional activator